MTEAADTLTPQLRAEQGKRRSPRRPLADRFWEKVCRIDDENSCWLWTGYVDVETGYGHIGCTDRRSKSAHRIGYELQCGPIPEGLWVLHKCDVRHCVRGSHLYCGTPTDNANDMYARGRAGVRRVRVGAAAARSALTEEQAREILASTESHKALAARFGVRPDSIKRLRDGTTWKSLNVERKPLGRKRRGEECFKTKLTEADVRAIRAVGTSRSQSDVAAEFGVTQGTISALLRGRSWKHIK